MSGQQIGGGRQTFVDGNGKPLAGGTITFYAPGTTTPQATYVDPGLTVANANPVLLDANGSCLLWGPPNTQWRQIVEDSFGNVVWDALVQTPPNPAAAPGQPGGNYVVATPANPTPSNSTSMAMLGIGIQLTPSKTGTVLAIVTGALHFGGSGTNNAKAQLFFGTGTPPANGNPPPGGAIPWGQPIRTDFTGDGVSGAAFGPVTLIAFPVGLTIGVQYWFDVGVQILSAGSTVTLDSPTEVVIEF